MRELNEQIAALEDELSDLYAMSEDAACFRYSVDCKQEAIDVLDEELQLLYQRAQESDDSFENINWGGVDPAFISLYDYNRMRY